MTLSSQSGRGRVGNRGFVSSSRKRKRRNRRIALVFALLIVVGGGYGIYAMLTGPKKETPTTPGDPSNTVADNTNRTLDPNTPTLSNPTGRPPLSPQSPTNHESAQPVVNDPILKETTTQPTVDPTPPTTNQPVVDSTTPPPPNLTAAFDEQMALARSLVESNQLVQARAILNELLHKPGLSAQDRTGIRLWLTELNNTLVFSPKIARDDPLAYAYTIQSGDAITRIRRRENLDIDSDLISRVNGIVNGNIFAGRTLKLLRGPFHAIVDKSSFRIDIYAGPTPTTIPQFSESAPTELAIDPTTLGWTYIRSFDVGLGEFGLTPIGAFAATASRDKNPSWVNPRTGEQYAKGDPNNPIGTRWTGLKGIDDATRSLQSYGLHGTIEPDSIGKERSMGCVRLRQSEIEIVYEMLMPNVSHVYIVP